MFSLWAVKVTECCSSFKFGDCLCSVKNTSTKIVGKVLRLLLHISYRSFYFLFSPNFDLCSLNAIWLICQISSWYNERGMIKQDINLQFTSTHFSVYQLMVMWSCCHHTLLLCTIQHWWACIMLRTENMNVLPFVNLRNVTDVLVKCILAKLTCGYTELCIMSITFSWNIHHLLTHILGSALPIICIHDLNF